VLSIVPFYQMILVSCVKSTRRISTKYVEKMQDKRALNNIGNS